MLAVITPLTSMPPSITLRRAGALLGVLACLASVPARAEVAAAIAPIESLASTEPARALSMLDGLAADAQRRGNSADASAIEVARCWILGYTAPAKAVALAARAGSSLDAPLRVCRGYALEQLGRGEEAMADYEFGVAEARRLKNDALLARALALRGEQRYVRGLYADAIDDLKASHDAALRTGNVGGRNYALNALANLYADKNVGAYDSALESYRTLLLAHEKSGNGQGQATAHYNIASTSEKKGDLGLARRHFEQALALDRARGVATDIATDQRAYAVVLSKLGEHARAIALLDSARQLAAADPGLGAAIILSRGAAYRRAGRHAEALADLGAAQRHFESPRNEPFLQKVYEEQALTHAALGNWKEAYAARGLLMATSERIQKQAMDERTARLRVQFQSEQARLRNTALQYENSVQLLELANTRQVRQWQLAALAASAVVILVLAIFAWRQRELGRKMQALALTDELTALPNRRHLMSLASEGFAHARQGGPLCVAALDIDHFKRINDGHGHAVGDLVLKRVAHALRDALQPGEVIGRTGGEEFIAILHGADELAALRAAERLRAAVAAIDRAGLPEGVAPRISIGVARYRSDDGSLDALLHRADEALYRAKERGRDRVELAAA